MVPIMSQEYFFIRPRIITSVVWILLSLAMVTYSVWAIAYFIFTSASSYDGVIIFFGVILPIFLTYCAIVGVLYRGIWKCTVQCSNIYYWSPIKRVDFTFDGIERIELNIVGGGYHTGPEMKTVLIFLRGRKRPILIPHKAVGINAFIECLKSKKILGSKIL